MRDLELSKRIEKRIQESKREYTPREQFAELLIRDLNFPIFAFEPDLNTLGRLEPDWGPESRSRINFLIRWGISDKWDSRKETLAENINSLPEVFFRKGEAVDNKDFYKKWGTSDKIGVLRCGLQPSELSQKIGALWAKDVPMEEDFIYIKVRPTTKKKDMDNLWPIIEKMQKEIWGYNDRAKQTFGRDLCWYDLNKKEEFGKQSLGRIRNLWISFFPKQNPPPRVIIQKAIERIEEFIWRKTYFGGY